MSKVLEVKNLDKSYDGQKVFSDLNLSLDEDTITVLFGKSGIGKTTLLKCLVVLEDSDSGDIFIEGKKVVDNGVVMNESLVRNKIGIVFQDFYLWDNKKVLNNITESLIFVKKLNKSEAESIAYNIAEQVDLTSDLLDKYPPELSRGQRQRVAIARTLAMNPEIILLDEPTASLDEALVGQVSTMIKKLKGDGRTVLIVSHDTKFVDMVGDRKIDFKDLQR